MRWEPSIPSLISSEQLSVLNIWPWTGSYARPLSWEVGKSTVGMDPAGSCARHVELTRGIPVSSGNVPFEATTPTGAAILATIVDAFSDQCAFSAGSSGCGIGHKEGLLPNILRIFIGESRDLPLERDPQ